MLVIFDFDGTLVNSVADVGTAANYALAKNELPTHPLERYDTFVGSGLKKLIERALPEKCARRTWST
jgi:phosphoglycolate phosphatase